MPLGAHRREGWWESTVGPGSGCRAPEEGVCFLWNSGETTEGQWDAWLRPAFPCFCLRAAGLWLDPQWEREWMLQWLIALTSEGYYEGIMRKLR